MSDFVLELSDGSIFVFDLVHDLFFEGISPFVGLLELANEVILPGQLAVKVVASLAIVERLIKFGLPLPICLV